MSSRLPQPRKPRRELRKRRRKDGDNRERATGHSINKKNPFRPPWSNKNLDDGQDMDNTKTEYRPLVSSVRRDMGEDYWIDPLDLEKERKREAQQKRKRQGAKDVIPEEKLWDEVKAPYQQNWIGYFSVLVAILSVIVLKFPELLVTPTISYPDL